MGLRDGAGSAILETMCDNLATQPTFEAAVAETLEAAIRVVGAHRGNIQLPEGDRLLIAENRGFTKPFLDTFREVCTADGSACGRSFRQRQPVVIPDVTEDMEYVPFRDAAAGAGYRGVVTAPLIATSGHLMGFVSTHFAHAHAPSAVELQRLNSICSIAGNHLQLLLGADTLAVKASRMQATVYKSA